MQASIYSTKDGMAYQLGKARSLRTNHGNGCVTTVSQNLVANVWTSIRNRDAMARIAKVKAILAA